jgi:thiol-disulfide isomerase/thioredoxin/YHS domain-containing protein
MAIKQTYSLGRAVFVATALITCVFTSQYVAAEETGVVWSTDVEGSLQKAAAEQRPVLMEFTASWCVYCKRMEKTTFQDPSVASVVNSRFIAIKVDADKHKALVKDLAIKGLPAMLVVAPDLQIMDRITGFHTAKALITRLDKVVPAAMISATPAATDISRPTAFQNGQEQGRDPFMRPPSASVEPAPAKPAHIEPAAPAKDVSGRVTLGDSFGNSFLPAVPDAAAPQIPTFETAPPVAETTPGLPLAFAGSCPVTAIDERRMTPGKAAYEIEHRGRTVRFASLEARISFESEPTRYWPMLDGACPVAFAETGMPKPGDLRFAVLFRKRIWLLADEASMNAFVESPGAIVQAALVKLQAATAQATR